MTKGALTEAAKRCQYNRLRGPQGGPPGLVGVLPLHSVLFVDNHDTGSSQQHWPHPPELVPAAYAYVLTHPGIPCVFWEHFDGACGAAISELIGARQRSGVRSDSRLEVLAAEADMYVAAVQGSKGRLVVKLGPRWEMGPELVPKASEGYRLAASGKDYAVWERTTYS